MLPYAFYKLVHILGIALALVSLGGLTVHALHGGAKQDNAARPMLVALPMLAMLAAAMAVYKPT